MIAHLSRSGSKIKMPHGHSGVFYKYDIFYIYLDARSDLKWLQGFSIWVRLSVRFIEIDLSCLTFDCGSCYRTNERIKT